MAVKEETIQLSTRIRQSVHEAIKSVQAHSNLTLQDTVEILLCRGLGLYSMEETPESRIERAVARYQNGRKNGA